MSSLAAATSSFSAGSSDQPASPRTLARNGSDDALIERLVARDPTAVNEFYSRYRRRIMAVALRVVSDPWDAEEVVQDVVWIVVRKAEGFRGEAEFSSWLYRVTQNCAKMLLRKRRRLPTPMDMADLEGPLAAHLANAAHLQPEQSAAERMDAERIGHHIERLDPVNREIFLMAAVAGEPAETVSAHLGLSILAVKARLHRVRQTLRHAIECAGIQPLAA